MPVFHKSSSIGFAGRRFARLLGVLTLGAGIALGACGTDDSTDRAASSPATGTGAGENALSGEAPVRIAGFEFKPQKVRVEPGTKVLWTNDDTAIHSVKDTSRLGTPVSKDMGQNDTFSITYDEPGSYSYICGIHQYMTGSVEVVN